MKRSQVLLFIISAIALLAVICAVFPEEGLAIGRATLHFPSLTEVLEGDGQDKGPSPEEIVAERNKAARAEKKEEYERYFREDPARFYLPGDDLHFFDRFFAALDNAEKKPVRIVHYGDSQIEEDRISSVIRKGLQEKFGGSGPGYLPLCTYYSLTASESASAEGRNFIVFGTADQRAGIRQYGPMGRFTRIDTAINYSFRIDPREKESAGASRVRLLSGNRTSALYLSCGGRKETVPAGKNMTFSTFSLQDSSRRFSLSVSGCADLYGILVDGKAGVSLDNVAMRGCSGEIFRSLDQSQLQSYFKETGTAMILLQYGGNRVPYTSSEKAMDAYKESMGKQIRLLKSLAPDAAIVLIGPADMSTTEGGKKCTYPHLKAFIGKLREAALENGAAYWDIYGAMGGNGSMLRWVSAKPALAGPDYIHFTPRGAEHIGKMFLSSLMMYYNYRNV